MEQRRAAQRLRMLKSGKIFLGSWGVPCTIRNLSDTGACLQVQTTYGIPSKFELALADGSAGRAGLSGLTAPSLGSSSSKHPSRQAGPIPPKPHLFRSSTFVTPQPE
jgi:hypothetical protein